MYDLILCGRHRDGEVQMAFDGIQDDLALGIGLDYFPVRGSTRI
jgi:hypothetical protein